MKLDTAVIIVKGACYLIVGVFMPWSVALAQWINSETWPSKIIWIGVILPASMIGGANALLAFLSGSWQDYKDGRAQLPITPEPPKT